jgi:exosome complex component RRP42
VEYKAQASIGTESALDTRQTKAHAADFEVTDYWDDGKPLENREEFPVAITLNIVRVVLDDIRDACRLTTSQLSDIHYLDATSLENAATPTKLLLVFSFPSSSQATPTLISMRNFGEGTLRSNVFKDLISVRTSCYWVFLLAHLCFRKDRNTPLISERRWTIG